MADFSTIDGKMKLIQDGRTMLDLFRDLYRDAKAVQTLLARYEVEAEFKAEVDHLFTPAQRQDLATMIGQLDQLLTAWEKDYASALGVG